MPTFVSCSGRPGILNPIPYRFTVNNVHACDDHGVARIVLAGLQTLQFAQIEGGPEGTFQVGNLDVVDTFIRVDCHATVAGEAVQNTLLSLEKLVWL